MNVSGYICAPHNNNNESIVETWKKSDNVGSMYFVTATFPSDSLPYFPNHLYCQAFQIVSRINYRSFLILSPDCSNDTMKG